MHTAAEINRQVEEGQLRLRALLGSLPRRVQDELQAHFLLLLTKFQIESATRPDMDDVRRAQGAHAAVSHMIKAFQVEAPPEGRERSPARARSVL